MAIKNQTGAQPDVVERFAPDVQSSSFQKPVNNCNVASGCPQFASQAQIFSVESGKSEYLPGLMGSGHVVINFILFHLS